MSEITPSIDVLILITEYLTDFVSIMTVSRVCHNWEQAVRYILPKMKVKHNIETYFKITKVRFLMDRIAPNMESIPPHRSPYSMAKIFKAMNRPDPIFHVKIYSNTKAKYVVLPLQCVGEDQNNYIYESNQLPPAWRLKRLRCEILWANRKCAKLDNPELQTFGVKQHHDKNTHTQIQNETSTHSADNDLSWQTYTAGRKYEQENEQVVIGSTNTNNNSFNCCCAIKLLPPGQQNDDEWEDWNVLE
jgi:hypothetical protein